MKTRGLLFVLVCLVASGRAQAERPFVRLLLGPGNDVVGALISETSSEFTIYDFKTLSERKVEIAKALKIEKPLTDEQAVKYVGIPPVLAYRIGELAGGANQSAQSVAKVAQVTPTAIYVTMGSNQGVAVGKRLRVFRPGLEIKDPDTGAVLARERPKVAELEVFEVSENLCKGRIIGGLEITLKPGDEVEGDVVRFMVAVLPITDEAGVETVGGSALREEMVNALVRQKVPVVERSELGKVLGEELMQHHALFDAKQAQQLGKQLGASVVVAGKVVPSDSSVVAHLRLVNVGTGEIKVAVSGTIKESAGGVAAVGAKAISSSQLQDLFSRCRTARLSDRKVLIRQIADTKQPAAAKFLAEEMLKQDPFATEDALASMGPVAADALINVINTGDLGERSRAMKVFVKVCTKKHIPYLQKLTSDFHLRREAERAISRLQGN